jgi:hypothetical protein
MRSETAPSPPTTTPTTKPRERLSIQLFLMRLEIIFQLGVCREGAQKE